MSTYGPLADLPLVVQSYALEGLARPWSAEFVRRTTVVRLRGDGHVGEGEDVTYTPDDHARLQDTGATLPLAGRFTLASFSAYLDELDLFPAPPQRQDSRAYRRWAFESAALDLALRQAGVSLAQALGRAAGPVRFVVSMRLPDPPSLSPILRRLELHPDMRFKLDATSAWDDALIDELAATGAVESVDFKGHYDGLPVDTAADADLYRQVAEGLPGVWLEDPALTPATEAALAAHADRITWDAPIRSVADIAALATRPRMVNVKPSRFGTLRAVLDAYDHLAAEGIGAYGGGQFELGPGRGQIQHLAALFHPDAPNDVAPLGHHEIAAGLPESPLAPLTEATGFRWTSTVECCDVETCCEPSAKAACCGPVSATQACGCR
jgi:L-alanine-DL-glutamate epimerase-like enolase superfamily enzyme